MLCTRDILFHIFENPFSFPKAFFTEIKLNLKACQTVTSIMYLPSTDLNCLQYTTKFSLKHFLFIQVVHTSAVRANKYYAKHPINGQFANDTDPIEIGSQVLIDILLLAKCDHFLHRESSVATLASFFNPEMKLFFIGHLGRDVPVVSSQLGGIKSHSDQIPVDYGLPEWPRSYHESLLS